MCPQINENLLAEIYVEVDDLYKAFQQWNEQKVIGPKRQPTRIPCLSPLEIVTIICAYHLSGFKRFEYFYTQCIVKTYHHCFSKAPTYQHFIPFSGRTLPLFFLVAMFKVAQSQHTGHYFIDSKKIEVCHVRRAKYHKVFQGFARKGKSSLGWFYGLKLHLVINHLGQIVAFRITPGSTADNNKELLCDLLQGLQGRCCGDKGYLTTLFEDFYTQGLHLIVRPKNKMKPLPVLPKDIRFTKQRALIESVNDILTTVCNVEHSRHRNPLHGMVNILSALIAYQYLEHKPHIFIPGAINYLQAA